MKPNKKPRSDSKLDSMPESRVMELRDKLLANEKYAEILEWLALECGVTCSASALTAFYKRHCAPVVRDRRLISVAKAEALGDAMERDPVAWDSQIIEKVKQYTFEFLDTPSVDPQALSFLVDSITKARKQDFTEKDTAKKRELEERKIALLEAKAKKADAAAEIDADEQLSAEEKAARLRQLFRMG